LTSFAAGFVRPDNGLISRLEISGSQEKQKNGMSAHSKKTQIFQKRALPIHR